jgi:hypothetical protein
MSSRTLPEGERSEERAEDLGATSGRSLAVVEQLRRALETNKKLHRRCQLAERATKDNVEQCIRSDVSFGRMLANWAATSYREALLQVRAESQQLVGMEDPFGSGGPPMLVGANAYFALVEALDELSQAEARAELQPRHRNSGGDQKVQT